MRTHRCNYHRDSAAHTAPLVLQVGVLPQQGSPFLLVEELVAGLAEKHKPVWIQILVVRGELVVHVQVLHTGVVLAAELAGLVAGRQHILSEQEPTGSQPELLVLLLQSFIKILSFHTQTVSDFLRSEPKKFYYW